jgi:hypothetical protein
MIMRKFPKPVSQKVSNRLELLARLMTLTKKQLKVVHRVLFGAGNCSTDDESRFLSPQVQEVLIPIRMAFLSDADVSNLLAVIPSKVDRPKSWVPPQPK